MKDMSVAEAELEGQTCAKARCVGLYNLGVLADVSCHLSRDQVCADQRVLLQRDSDAEEATKYLDRAILASREIDYKEGQRKASEALRRIGATKQS